MNALGRLRNGLGVQLDILARRLSLTVAEVQSFESLALGPVRLEDLNNYLNALGCRLDLVAVASNGLSHWLSDDRGEWLS